MERKKQFNIGYLNWSTEKKKKVKKKKKNRKK